MASSGLGGLRSANACGQLRLSAHLTTVVFRRLVLRMAHGSGGLNLVSDALRSRVFDLLRRNSKHSKRLSDTVSEKNRLLFVGFTHTHLDRCCTASAFVSICVASWKIMTSLSVFTLMRPLALLGAGACVRSRAGRCAGRVAGVIFLV